MQHQLQGDEYARHGQYKSAQDEYQTALKLENAARRQVRRLSQNRTVFETLNDDSMSAFVTEADLFVKLGQMHIKAHDYEMGMWHYRQAVQIYKMGGGGGGARSCISYQRYTRQTYQNVAHTLKRQGWTFPVILSYLSNSLSYGIAHETAGMVFKYQFLLQVRQDEEGRRLGTINSGLSTTTLGQSLSELESAIRVEETSGVGLTGLPLAHLYAQVAELYFVSSKYATSSLLTDVPYQQRRRLLKQIDDPSMDPSYKGTTKKTNPSLAGGSSSRFPKLAAGSSSSSPSPKSFRHTNKNVHSINTTTSTNHHIVAQHAQLAISRYNKALALYTAIFGSSHPETIRIAQLVESLACHVDNDAAAADRGRNEERLAESWYSAYSDYNDEHCF
jgi:hypothetical protein